MLSFSFVSRYFLISVLVDRLKSLSMEESTKLQIWFPLLFPTCKMRLQIEPLFLQNHTVQRWGFHGHRMSQSRTEFLLHWVCSFDYCLVSRVLIKVFRAIFSYLLSISLGMDRVSFKSLLCFKILMISVSLLLGIMKGKIHKLWIVDVLVLWMFSTLSPEFLYVLDKWIYD